MLVPFSSKRKRLTQISIINNIVYKLHHVSIPSLFLPHAFKWLPIFSIFFPQKLLIFTLLPLYSTTKFSPILTFEFSVCEYTWLVNKVNGHTTCHVVRKIGSMDQITNQCKVRHQPMQGVTPSKAQMRRGACIGLELGLPPLASGVVQ